MKKILLLLNLCLIQLSVFGQTPSITYATAPTAVQNLLGDNVTITSVSFSGDSRQLATFTGGDPKIGFTQGVAMTTGNALFAETNQTSNVGDAQSVNSNNYDSDIDQITGSVENAVVLEFDFISTGDNISFQIVFASEEYLEYVGTEFNDAIGFFLSGPGISGPFSNNAINIAQLPNGDPITINDVNHLSNSNYFFQGDYGFAYDGQTVPITIQKEIQCNVEYHLKIVICNTGDDLFDSGLFLNKRSLTSTFELGSLSSNTNPICAGDEFLLTVNGDPEWDYSWSTGQQAQGLTQITAVADLSTTTYTVTATNSSGCSISRTIDVLVSSPNNLPPTMDGINGTGEYTYYVSAGDLANFNSTLYNDNTSEVIVYLESNNIPSNFTAIAPSSSGGNFSFYWQTNQYTPTGSYTYTLRADDQNACIEGIGVFTFTIIVVCTYCPVCVSYENRTPVNYPLPPSTSAGKCIEVGFNEVVEIGNGNSVYFQAGESIEMGPFFDTNSGEYEAIIDPSTCITDCEDCCDDWAGFTIDPIPNVFTPNGDGVNEVWFVHDNNNPWCAFNATSFELYILIPGGQTVYQLVSNEGQGCCPFRSSLPTPSSPSSIFWDGVSNVGLNQGTKLTDGVYFYILYLHGCGNSQSYSGFIHINPSTINLTEDNLGGLTEIKNLEIDLNEQSSMDELIKDDQLFVEPSFLLFPNPTEDIIRIRTSQQIKSITVLNADGKLVIYKTAEFDQQIDLSSFSNGNFIIRTIFEDGTSNETSVLKY